MLNLRDRTARGAGAGPGGSVCVRPHQHTHAARENKRGKRGLERGACAQTRGPCGLESVRVANCAALMALAAGMGKQAALEATNFLRVGKKALP